jgi:hypothetical protein
MRVPNDKGEGEQVNSEYYEAKARLCQKTAISQILEGNEGEGIKNLMRMVNALTNAEMARVREDEEATQLL